MAKYKKKPVVIEAIQWNGNNYDELTEFGCMFEKTGNHVSTGDIIIPTLEGDHTARVGWWIIKGVQGEFYPCKPDIFEQTYEAV